LYWCDSELLSLYCTVQIEQKLTIGAVLSVPTAIRLHAVQKDQFMFTCLYHCNCVSANGCLYKQLRERLMYLAHCYTNTVNTPSYPLCTVWSYGNKFNEWINKLWITTVLSNVYYYCATCFGLSTVHYQIQVKWVSVRFYKTHLLIKKWPTYVVYVSVSVLAGCYKQINIETLWPLHNYIKTVYQTCNKT